MSRAKAILPICTYGGYFEPLPDNPGRLHYVGGLSKLYSLHRRISLETLLNTLADLFDAPFDARLVGKYRLHLTDDLVDLNTDDDFELMIKKYDQWMRERGEVKESTAVGGRLRFFIAVDGHPPLIDATKPTMDFSLDDEKLRIATEDEWLIKKLLEFE